MGFSRVSRAQRARIFFWSLQKSVRLLWISCLFESLTGVFEVSSAACRAFLIKPFVLIGGVFSPGPGARHARILFVGAFKVTYFRSRLLFSFVLWISCAAAVISSCEPFNSGRRNRYVMLWIGNPCHLRLLLSGASRRNWAHAGGCALPCAVLRCGKM